MSTAVDVKTLIIDGEDVSARAGQTILEVARENDINIPTLCHLDGLKDVGACRLCLVEIKGLNKLLPACVCNRRRGHGSHHQFREAAEVSPHDSGDAVCRAQSHLFGVRGQRELRIAVDSHSRRD